MSENKELMTTGQKALTVNLDPPVYGTFAEIGAGQEVGFDDAVLDIYSRDV